MQSIKLMIISILVNGFSLAYGDSGGWVGNAPIASYTPQVAFQSYRFNKSDEKKWNSILLPEGKSRFNINYNYCYMCSNSNSYLNFGYSHGFSSDLTMLDLLTFGYSLKSGSGAGSEWAVIFGLTDGLLFSSTFGTSVGPGIGLSYAYSDSDWRFDFSTILSGYYNTKYSFWRNYKLSAVSSVTYWFDESWGGGLSTSYLYRSDYSKTISCGEGCASNEELPGYNNFTDPKIYVLLKINEFHQLTLGLKSSFANDRDIINLGYLYEW